MGAMKIAVLGTGMVGRTLAARLAGLGHEVAVGTRDPELTLGRTASDGTSFAHWQEEHGAVGLETFEGAAAEAELVIHAASGAAALSVLEQAGAQNLAGKVLLDTSLPVYRTQGFPPSLFVMGDDSLGERVQRAFPEARVVKTLNTLTAPLMVEPVKLEEETSVFVSGNDPEAKRVVTDLLMSFGHTDVIDLGDITTARGTEMAFALWVRLMGSFGTPMFNFRIVR
jgi:8-hydroxy-5-deazaflavin:NADPH oxidoreductase